MNSNEITTYIAIYGALLSTVAIVWNIVRDLGDRANLVVKARIVQVELGLGLKGDRVGIELVNDGKRPITVVEIGYKLEPSNGLKPLHSSGLPKELGEKQFYQIHILPEDMGNLDNVSFVFARDSSGRLHKSKKNPLVTLFPKE